MKIKRIIAKEWLIFLVCIFIGIVSYILDDYLSWKRLKVQSTSFEELVTKTYNFTGIPNEKKTFLDFQPITPEKYKLSEGYSEHWYLLFVPYFLSLFIRSIIWSIRQLREKL